MSLISPTHKRTEGRAPVWGSELTSKDATLQGGNPAETADGLNVKLRDLTDCVTFFKPLIKAAAIKSHDSEIKSRRGAV